MKLILSNVSDTAPMAQRVGSSAYPRIWVLALALVGCARSEKAPSERSSTAATADPTPAVEAPIQQSQLGVETPQALALAVELKDSTASATVPSTGGSVTLPGFATVSFPAGAFRAPQLVRLAATSDTQTQAEFRVTSPSAEPAVGYDIRINTGPVAPALDLQIEIRVPDAFLASLPPNHGVAAFAQFLEGGQEELHDFFERLPSSTFDPDAKIVRASLDRLAFRDERRADGTFEAILLVGAVERPGR